MSTDLTFNNSFVNNQDEITIMSSLVNLEFLSKAVLDESGIVQWSSWHDTRWVEYWSAPQEFCDKYSSCGPNSYCNPYNGVKFECTCFPGFEPKSSRDWYLRDGSGGCLRKKQGVSICNDGEGFVKVEHLKVPDTSIAHVNMSLSLQKYDYAKKNDLNRKKRMLAILGVSVAVLFLLVVSVVYLLIMRKKIITLLASRLEQSSAL
ncbi:hypothetical protein CMV_004041 [Castanea mollissima]|uniref:S-locus glycoprotein domain-containing protein n=1 Tax=Castanea mollissima TaxID=60419 RepID=A0A8J4RGA4_9ROSI|nr:hypothetical protein CMV_004041 [Castanea mollissima]